MKTFAHSMHFGTLIETKINKFYEIEYFDLKQV